MRDHLRQSREGPTQIAASSFTCVKNSSQRQPHERWTSVSFMSSTRSILSHPRQTNRLNVKYQFYGDLPNTTLAGESRTSSRSKDSISCNELSSSRDDVSSAVWMKTSGSGSLGRRPISNFGTLILCISFSNSGTSLRGNSERVTALRMPLSRKERWSLLKASQGIWALAKGMPSPVAAVLTALTVGS